MGRRRLRATGLLGAIVLILIACSTLTSAQTSDVSHTESTTSSLAGVVPSAESVVPLPLVESSLSVKSTPGRLRAMRPRLTSEGDADDDDDVVTFWPNFFAKFMSASYLLLCLMSGIQLLRTIVHRHKIRSFRFGFLLVCFLWTLLRVIFWFIVSLHTWPTWLSDLIYFLPNACQIGTFSLLILFYAKLVHRHRWRSLRLRFLGFCILSNTAMVFLTLTFSILMDRVERTQREDPTSTDAKNVQQFVDTMYFLCSAMFFGVLVVLAAFYIHKLRTSRGSTAGTSKQEVLVTSLIFLIFLSRCVWDVMAAFDPNSTIFRHQIRETATNHVKLMSPMTFFLVFLWEVVPTLMVIAYFRNIPNTSDSYCVGLWSCCHEGSKGRRCLAGWPCFFPDDYFEPTADADAATPSASNTRTVSRNDLAPEYAQMEDDESAGLGLSSALPPGNFVRSSSISHSQQYATGSFSAYGRNYATGSVNGPPGLISTLAGGVHLGVGNDLYGSPTWLNPTHPALSHLTPAMSLPKHQLYPTSHGHFAHSATAAAPQQQGPYAHTTYYEDEEESQYTQYAVHPYTQQQQQLQQQHHHQQQQESRAPLLPSLPEQDPTPAIAAAPSSSRR